MNRKSGFKSIFVLTFLLFLSLATFANKTTVKVLAPEKVNKGSEITIKLEITHMGNSKGHHTDWVWLKINGNEVKRWEYSRDHLPENENFIIEYKVRANQNLEIIAEGNCNRHGTKGEDKFTVIVE